MKKTAYLITGTIGLTLAGISAQAGIATSIDGIAFEGGAWNVGSQQAVGWTITATGADMRGVTNTIAFTSSESTAIELGAPGTRIAKHFLRFAGSFLQTSSSGFDGSYSWFTDGDTIDLSGAANDDLDFASGLTQGSNWAFINIESAPINYTGYTAELGGVSQAALELIWDDADNSGTRSTGDTYDFGRIFYATGDDTFDGGSWSGGAPTIPEPGTYALLAGLTGLAFVAMRRRRR